MKRLIALLIVALIAYPAVAQATRSAQYGDFLTILRGQMKRPLQANIMERLVTIEASPSFWTRINESNESLNNHPVKLLSAYGENLGYAAKNLGLGDIEGTMYQVRNADAPPVVSVIESLKGKVDLTIVMNFEPTNETFNKTMEQTEVIASQLGNSYHLKPRGGQFHGRIIYSDKATEATVKVSPDGNRYEITVPIYVSKASNLSAIVAGLKKGQ